LPLTTDFRDIYPLLSQQPTVNSQQPTVNSQQSTANSQQSTVNSQQDSNCMEEYLFSIVTKLPGRSL